MTPALTNADLHARVAGQTLPLTFLETVRRHGTVPALRWRDSSAHAATQWRSWTWAELADQVARVAAGLRELGIGRGDRVLLMFSNSPEFHVADMATLMVGATPISIYNSSSPEQVRFVAESSGAKLAMVEDEGYLARFLEIRGVLADLAHVVVGQDDSDEQGTGWGGSGVVPWARLLAVEPLDLAEAATVAQPDDLVTVIYTSGTTGPPKGVMLTHTNVLWTVQSLLEAFGFTDLEGLRVVSYLPMAHIAERMVSLYCGVVNAYTVTTCPDPADIADYARHVRPEIIFGVPRVWEKVHATVTAALAADPEKGAKFDEAVQAALPISERITWDEANYEDISTYEFLDAVAFRPVRELIGLDQCRLAVTGAAPIPAEIIRWYRAIGVPLSEVYGLSESSGPVTFAAHQVRPGSTGPAIPGSELVLADDGEVLTRGGHIFAGYLGAPEQTAEVLDADGWLHTGDIGELDADGYLRIVDRKKELIITAGGKNVSPANLEAALKLIPLVGQACVIGDRRPFVSALVTLDPDLAPTWARQHGIETTDLADLAVDPQVVAEIDRGLREVMAKFNHAEQVKKVRILGEEWLPDSEVLTPTSKLKRRGISDRYATEIDALYAKP